MNQVTQLLASVQAGNAQAASDLLPIVYDELRRLAAQKMVQEKPGQTLQPTELVHEAYLRLIGPANGDGFVNRQHFFAAAAEAMRRILIDNARRKLSAKRGGALQRVEFNEEAFLEDSHHSTFEDLLALDDALQQLEHKDPVKAQLVKLRYFAGLPLEDAALALDISTTTANRYWIYTKCWLYGKIHGR